MTITLAGLMAADTGAVRAFADHLERMARQIDEAVGDLGTAARDLPHYWSAGPGAAAAAAQDADLRQRLSTAYDPANWGARMVRDLADNLDHFRQMAHSVLAEAVSKGFRVDVAGGTVTGTGPLAGGAPMIGLQAAQSTADYYVQLLTDILDQANQCDLSTQAWLARSDPGGAELPIVPTDSTHPTQPTGVTAETLRRKSPDELAEWWQVLDPLTRQQLLDRFPEVIGASVGLPSRYRDAANRVLLARRHAELLAEQQRLPDGPGLQRVQMDLAAADRLRKSDAYLVDYVPGDEQHTRLSDGDDPKWDALWVF